MFVHLIRSHLSILLLKDNKFDFDTKINFDIVLKARWKDENESDVKTYTVVFKDFDGTILKEETVEEGKNATAPSNPSRDGYDFIGWDKEYNNITSNLEINAKYEITQGSKIYTISYELGGRSWGYYSKNEYLYDFLKDFYDFVSPNESLNIFIYGDSNSEYLGTWVDYIGGAVGKTNKLLCDNNLEANSEDYFLNCSKYKEKWAPLGKWVQSQHNRFAGTGGYYYGALDFYRYVINDPNGYISIYGEEFYGFPSVNEPTLVEYTTSSKSIVLPRPLDSEFGGWYLNSDFSGKEVTEISPNTQGNLVLYALWNKKVTYEISFDTDGGKKLNPITVHFYDEVILPNDLVKEGFTFIGWSLNGVALTESFKFTYRTSIVIKAIWKNNNVVLEDLKYDNSPVYYRNTNNIVQIPSDYVQPDKQLRAAWVSSYAGNFSPSPIEANMKAELNSILDMFEKYNLNCMIFHIRPTNNAFYQTDLAPISSEYSYSYEAFEQWDYLTWLIDECHKRGIEFHAWLNPYRIKAYGFGENATTQTVADKYKDYPKNPASDPENILLTYRSDGNKGAILNPYEEEVQDYIVDVCIEVMEKYDVDAIHFDDYFYAQMSSGIKVLEEPDQDDYIEYINANPNCGFSKNNENDKKQWRRENVDAFIKKLSIAMTDYNKENGKGVQLGISPTGIYKNGNGSVESGSNTAGQEHYSSYLFCDTKKWIKNEWIDYIMPQTYWAFTHKVAGYADVLDWWDKVVDGTKVNLYSGIGIYMSVSGGNYSWGVQPYEVSNQILYTTKLKNVKGISFYSYGSLKTIDRSTSQIAYKGLQKVINEYWTTKIPTPETMASQYKK